MKKTPSWISKFGIHQIVAVVLVLAIAGFLGTQWAGGKLRAATTSNYILTVALTDDQPATLSQADENQKVAQFRLTTDSPEPVVVSAFKFNLTGGIKNKVYRLTTLVPLSIVYEASPIGLGESWLYDYGLLEQTVILSKNLTVAKNQPAVIDVYADLTRQKDQAFGLELAGIDSPMLAEGIPVQSTLYKIKR